MSNRVFKPVAIVLGVFAAFCIICTFGDQGIEALASFTIGVGILLAL